jgi:FtsP/CotA-like multicopper oxidase with cupredoxin domain
MNKQKIFILSSLLLVSTLLISSCAVPATGGAFEDAILDDAMEEEALEEDAMIGASTLVEFTLVTGTTGSGLAFFGQGGEIDGLVNPVLIASAGDTVRIILINGDGMPHDIFLPDIGVQSAMTAILGEHAIVEFKVSISREFVYFCSVPGHRAAGMEGMLVVMQ